MTAHLHHAEIHGFASGRLAAADLPQAHRHLDECELCLRRLIDAEIRIVGVRSEEQIQAS